MSLIDKILKNIATLSFAGYFPVAPGTCGSFIAFAFFVLLKPSPLIHALIVLLIIPIGTASSHIAEKLLKDKDSRHIVIDEFCGYFISVLFIRFSIVNALAAFFLFRFFDILKPFPINRIEKSFKGGIGIMADDVVAAIYANMVLQAWVLIY
jgi:phosphatidylglycerophosphatase A